MNTYIVTDVETGGIGEDVSLLTAYFGVLDENLNLLGELDFKLIPNNGIYNVRATEGNGLAINKIDLIEHSKTAISYKEAGTILFDFLKQHSEDGKLKLEPLGHNVYFDIVRIKNDLISEGSWLKFVSYRILDTGGIGNFLKKVGMIPKEISGSLSSYCDYFKLDNSNAHNAKADCMMVVGIYRKMMELFG